MRPEARPIKCTNGHAQFYVRNNVDRIVCWGKLELNSAGHQASRTKFGDPWSNMLKSSVVLDYNSSFCNFSALTYFISVSCQGNISYFI